MRILIVSDTHGKIENFRKACQLSQPVDLLVHCGDLDGGEDRIISMAGCPVKMVAGNNDFFSDLPMEEEFLIGDYKVFLTHGHYLGVGMSLEILVEEAVSREADIVMYGHTHRPEIRRYENIIALNPGSLSYPRQKGRNPSYIIMELDEDGKASFDLKFLE